MPIPFPTNFCIVDDDREYVEFLAEYLRARGSRATGFVSAEELLATASITEFDFFIVDLNLGKLDGVDLISLIRAQTSCGILVASGRMGPDAFNSALAAGADMFINKPVRFDQIFHAAASVSRRIGASRTAAAGSWVFDGGNNMLISPAGTEVQLSPVEMRIMARLHAARTAPVERAELFENPAEASAAESRNLDAAIFRLRRKIERDTGQRPPFRTVHGVGYQLVEVMQLRGPADGAA